MERVTVLINKLSPAAATTLTITLAGGLGAVLATFGEFWMYVGKHRLKK